MSSERPTSVREFLSGPDGRNVGGADRLLRAVTGGGALLVAAAGAVGVVSLTGAAVGFAALFGLMVGATAVTRRCWMNYLFGVDSCRR